MSAEINPLPGHRWKNSGVSVLTINFISIPHRDLKWKKKEIEQQRKKIEDDGKGVGEVREEVDDGWRKNMGSQRQDSFFYTEK